MCVRECVCLRVRVRVYVCLCVLAHVCGRSGGRAGGRTCMCVHLRVRVGVHLVTGCRLFPLASSRALVQSNFRVLPLLSRGRAYAALLRHPVIKSLIRSVSSCGDWTWHVV